MSDEAMTVKQGLLELLEETFEQPQGYYLDRAKGGLLETLEAISAERASLEVAPQRSIAAHVEHLRVYVKALHGYMNGAGGKTDWDASWQTHAVSEPEWLELRLALRRDYDALMQDLRGVPDKDSRLVEAMAIVTHTAYHFGAIRQLLLAAT
jgi:hypothetical protein